MGAHTLDLKTSSRPASVTWAVLSRRAVSEAICLTFNADLEASFQDLRTAAPWHITRWHQRHPRQLSCRSQINTAHHHMVTASIKCNVFRYLITRLPDRTLPTTSSPLDSKVIARSVFASTYITSELTCDYLQRRDRAWVGIHCAHQQRDRCG